MTLRTAFVAAVSEEMDRDDRIVLLLGDISVFAFAKVFEKHPTRALNIGACEQGMVGFAAGLALEGYYPVVSTLEPFLVRRAYEFIRLGFYEQGLKGLFVGQGGGHENARLGPTHECPEGLLLAGQCFDRIYTPKKEPSVTAYIHHAIRDRELTYIRLEEHE